MRAVAAAGAAAGAAVLLAACGSSAGGPPHPLVARAGALLTAPVQSSFAAGGTSYAILPMGDLGQPLDTFWQLVALRPGAAGLTLVTPPGVADNDGLVVAAGAGGRLTAGFLPSGALTFSPLAATTDGGAAWHAVDPVSGRLLSVPDALAGGSGTPTLALAATSGGGVLVAGGPGGSWTSVASAADLAATGPGRTCGLQRLTAVALAPGGVGLAGATCGRPVAGILVHRSSGWALAPVVLPSGLRGGAVSVLRLTSFPGRPGASTPHRDDPAATGGLCALLAGAGNGASRATSLAAAWATTGGPWRVSPALPLGAGAGVVATGFGLGGEVVVLWRDARGRLHADLDPGPTAGWKSLPTPPAGTEALVAGAAGAAEALTATPTVLTAWHLAAGAPAWTKGPQLRVPISFGSSG